MDRDCVDLPGAEPLRDEGARDPLRELLGLDFAERRALDPVPELPLRELDEVGVRVAMKRD